MFSCHEQGCIFLRIGHFFANNFFFFYHLMIFTKIHLKKILVRTASSKHTYNFLRINDFKSKGWEISNRENIHD